MQTAPIIVVKSASISYEGQSKPYMEELLWFVAPVQESYEALGKCGPTRGKPDWSKAKNDIANGGLHAVRHPKLEPDLSPPKFITFSRQW